MSDSSIVIKKALASDASLAARLIAELLRDFNEKSGATFTIDTEKLSTTAEELLKRDNYAIYFAFASNGAVVGLITLSQGSAIYNGGDFCVITELYVSHAHRSSGIGNLLVEQAKNFAKEKGWKQIEVGAPDVMAWPRTIEFYKKKGFKEKGPKLRLDL